MRITFADDMGICNPDTLLSDEGDGRKSQRHSVIFVGVDNRICFGFASLAVPRKDALRRILQHVSELF